eukprot:365067_1
MANMVTNATSPNVAKRNWYIQNKYPTFKDEMVDNQIWCISLSQWINLVQKASIHIDSAHVKKIKCPRKQSAKFYEMKYGDVMQEQHLIAMMLYCNCDTLQKKLSETYRKKNSNESDEELKLRHRNYYFWARLLRENVECFGTTKPKNKEFTMSVKLFCGINKEFTFKSMLANINGPLSTTTEFSVAVNFAQSEVETGLILELEMNTINWYYKSNEGREALNRLTCFNCQWISDFSNEMEIFCIGGMNPFRFANITTAHGDDFTRYITALNQLTAIMSNDMNWSRYPIALGWSNVMRDCVDTVSIKPTSKFELQLVLRLLSHELYTYEPNHPLAFEWKKCPEYVKKILHLHCTEVSRITFFEQKNEIYDTFFREKNGCIKLDVLTAVFPNISMISFYEIQKDTSFIIGASFIESILEFISSHNSDKIILRNIGILMTCTVGKQILNHVQSFSSEIEKLNGWTIVFMQMNPERLGINHNCISDPNVAHLLQPSTYDYVRIMQNNETIYALTIARIY